MATGIISSRERLVLRLAFLLEGTFADVAECTQIGGGIQETRPEYLRVYKRSALRAHPDGTRFAVTLNAAAKAKLASLKTAIAARRNAGTASAEEADLDDLPAETTLDASWDPVP